MFNNIIKKGFISILVSLIIFISLSPLITNASFLDDAANRMNAFGNIYNEETPSIPEVAASIIQTALSFLGLLFIVLLVYAGFLWMTAGGDQDRVTKAKQIMSNVVVGLIIIFSSYAISYFILKQITKATGTFSD